MSPSPEVSSSVRIRSIATTDTLLPAIAIARLPNRSASAPAAADSGAIAPTKNSSATPVTFGPARSTSDTK